MTRSRHAVARPPATRKWLAMLALLSFFLQSLAVQTHIHVPPALNLAKVAQGTSAPAPSKSQDPIDQCRLCQELVHSGHFIAPSAIAAVAIFGFATAYLFVLPSQPDRSATAFFWNSRAPPRR